jgi:hypothetical protein
MYPVIFAHRLSLLFVTTLPIISAGCQKAGREEPRRSVQASSAIHDGNDSVPRASKTGSADLVPEGIRGICRSAPGAAEPVRNGRVNTHGILIGSTTLAHTVEGGPPLALRCVARTDSELQRLRGTVGIPDSVARHIDLRKGIVVAVTMGSQRSTGYDIFAGPVKAVGDSLLVGVLQVLPAGPIVGDLVTSPADVVFIPRKSPNVVFFDH